jgi:tRNA(Ile)-lysidine synthase
MSETSLSIHVQTIVSDITLALKSLKSKPLYIGYSGGVDSTLLLTLSCRALGPENVVAIHINHQLSENADFWMQHARDECARLGCKIETRRVDVQSGGSGIEAAARLQRYTEFGNVVHSGATLALGHHLDDQVETFFLRMFRGAGKHGLRGIAKHMDRDHYQVVRPLLDIPREQIEQIATELTLCWIEDDSNQDESFDRNFLRQTVLPAVGSRWPGYRDKVIQTMSLFVDETETNVEGNQFDVEAELELRMSHDMGFKLVQLAEFTEAQIMSLLHLWLTRMGLQIPSRSRLKSVVETVINSKADAQPEVELSGGLIRRHGPVLYWVQKQISVSDAPPIEFNHLIQWSGVGSVNLIEDDIHEFRLKRALPNLHWSVRKGGESMRPVGRSKRRDLKRLFQEYRFKPWLRDCTPLLLSGDELVAVGDSLISADHLALPGEPGFRVIWQIS